MAKRVQAEDIIKMNELYLTIGTYAGVGRAVGFSGSTVKRYIQPDYQSQEVLDAAAPQEKIVFNIPEMKELVYPSNWADFLKLTEAENKACDELRKSILL